MEHYSCDDCGATKNVYRLPLRIGVNCSFNLLHGTLKQACELLPEFCLHHDNAKDAQKRNRRVWNLFFQIHATVRPLNIFAGNLANVIWDVFGEPGEQSFTIWR